MAKPANAEFTAVDQRRVVGRPFPAGVSGNPAGRPAGAKAVFSQDFIRDVHDAWSRHGVAALDMVAMTEPAKFLSVCASLMPKDLNISTDNSVKVALDAVAAFRVLVEQPAAEIKLIRDAATKAE